MATSGYPIGVTASADAFGPEVLFTALMDQGVQFHYIGFITHEAAQRYNRRHRGQAPRPQGLSHGDNLIRLAFALRSVGASGRTGTGELAPFTGHGSDVARTTEIFETRHGTIHITTYPSNEDRALPGSLSNQVRVVISIPTARLRGYIASGRFDDLGQLLEIVQLLDTHNRSDSPS
ncbi:hypothetical protein ACFYO1_13195 [Nocardia sp. NPDC006044]|uniref:hypothetical protein n=1 Tax=Nocardia sp. NPDC006044 TaxID=3364306 RepID=UPI003690BF11